jgi:uncharacterized membrane protein YcaP (DUF421 family)
VDELAALFRFGVAPLELVLRGSAMYWFLFLLLRFVLRRDAGALGIADLLLLVLIADAAQNGMAGDYKSITDGMILVATIIGWNVLFDWVAFRFPRVGKFIEPAPLALVEHGRINRRNLREEFLSEEELMAKLREQGIDRIDDVKRATMESDGTVSVIRYDGRNHEQAKRKLPV